MVGISKTFALGPGAQLMAVERLLISALALHAAEQPNRQVYCEKLRELALESIPPASANEFAGRIRDELERLLGSIEQA